MDSPGSNEPGAFTPAFLSCSQPPPADSPLSTTYKVNHLLLFPAHHSSSRIPRKHPTCCPTGTKPAGGCREEVDRQGGLSMLCAFVQRNIVPSGFYSQLLLCAFFSIIFPFPADSHWLKGPLSWCKSWRWPSTSPPGVAKSILPFQPGDHPPSSQDPSQDKSQLGYCSELPPEDSPPGLLHGPASATITCIILPVVPRDADGLELQGWTSRGEKKTPTVALSIHGCVFVGVFPYSEV